jgi:hypothetical protein
MSGTSSSILHLEELSITTAPFAAKIGAKIPLTVEPAEKRAISTFGTLLSLKAETLTFSHPLFFNNGLLSYKKSQRYFAIKP